jgi:hypothetical protein
MKLKKNKHLKTSIIAKINKNLGCTFSLIDEGQDVWIVRYELHLYFEWCPRADVCIFVVVAAVDTRAMTPLSEMGGKVAELT